MVRLRIRFRRGEEIKFISHLDIMRLWLRALVRAGVELAYSEGYNPHPRMSLAAPLALGVTSEAELMDVFLARPTSSHTFTSAVGRQLPAGLQIMQVLLVPPVLPSLQSQVRFAEYRVTLNTEKKPPEIKAAIDALLAKKELPWQHQRDTGPHRYDLRALISDIRLTEGNGASTLEMKLRCDSNGSGRPEQVAAALGFTDYPASVHRTKLILKTS